MILKETIKELSQFIELISKYRKEKTSFPLAQEKVEAENTD